jgi:hypothetical protein
MLFGKPVFNKVKSPLALLKLFAVLMLVVVSSDGYLADDEIRLR